MGWLWCTFITGCRWLWLFDAMDEPGHYIGVYQCRHCKTVSLGAFREKH